VGRAFGLKAAITAQLERYQATVRYVLPVMGLILISSCGLWLCRVWVHERWFG
jgi:hypothetical protein